jgi:hypothetical protein
VTKRPAPTFDLDEVIDAFAERVAVRVAEKITPPPAPAPATPDAADSSWLTAADAARHLNVSVHTLELWRKNGRGPRFCRIGTRAVRYARADLDSFARENK